MKQKRVKFENDKTFYPRLKLRDSAGKHEIFFEYALANQKQMGSDDFQQFLEEFESDNNQQNNTDNITYGDIKTSGLDSSYATDLNMSTSFRDYRNSTLDDVSFLVRKGKENTANHIAP